MQNIGRVCEIHYIQTTCCHISLTRRRRTTRSLRIAPIIRILQGCKQMRANHHGGMAARCLFKRMTHNNALLTAIRRAKDCRLLAHSRKYKYFLVAGALAAQICRADANIEWNQSVETGIDTYMCLYIDDVCQIEWHNDWNWLNYIACLGFNLLSFRQTIKMCIGW